MAKFVCLSKECKAGAAGGPLVIETAKYPPPGWAMVKVSIDYGPPKGLVAIIQGVICPHCAPKLGFLNADSTYVPPPKKERDPNEAKESEPESPKGETMTISSSDVGTVSAEVLTGEKA